ncbi:hypothetical protein [Bacillus sp. S1-R5C1-FB]|uniref:hypothetical protein n=1 Tax=Bacillus sp. S1-R5C1-FB TaxID=1973491 RepID=UPI00115517F6|nr:hypothetical protein [Bacillus sp. S1-R5C1-FB]
MCVSRFSSMFCCELLFLVGIVIKVFIDQKGRLYQLDLKVFKDQQVLLVLLDLKAFKDQQVLLVH